MPGDLFRTKLAQHSHLFDSALDINDDHVTAIFANMDEIGLTPDFGRIFGESRRISRFLDGSATRQWGDLHYETLEGVALPPRVRVYFE